MLGQSPIELVDLAGQYRLHYQPASHRYKATPGQPIRYLERQRRRMQDWLRFPVTGISASQIAGYLAWLSRDGGVPGARVCSEDEWERAARGADGRKFSHGNDLDPDDANFDRTYGQLSGAYGFDEVGSHPRSRSPFGVDDMIGNARECTIPVFGERSVFALRGGTYYHDSETAAAANRDVLPLGKRGSSQVGLRVCADVPVPASE